MIGVAAIALVIVSVLVPPFKHYWQGLFSETGRFDAQRVERWRARRRDARQRRTNAGEDRAEPAAVPALATPFEPPVVGLKARRAAIVTIGAASPALPAFLEPAAAEWRRDIRPVEPTEWAEDPAGAERRLVDAASAAVQEAAGEVAAGRRDWLAVVLDMPLSGEWPHDARLDLGGFFAALFAPAHCLVWLTYSEPVDPSPWPQETFLESRETPEQLTERLKAAGLDELAVARPTVVGRAIRLDRGVAARALPLLAKAGEEPARRPLPEALPSYSSYLALAIRTEDPMAIGSSSTRETRLATELQALMEEEGLRLTGIAGPGTPLLPLTPFRGQVVAWRAAAPAEAEDLVQPDVGDDLSTESLEEALAEGAQAPAAEILARYGRAWIETPRAAEYLQVLESVRHAFTPESAPALWARFLIGLDSALRLNRPDAHWFTEETCRAARAHGLEPLVRAERMEFTRLRGELEDAVGLAPSVLGALENKPERTDPGTVYARATARFVLANLLRRGGRYDLAREQLAIAMAAYDPVQPSHAVEAMHCRYALAVCDAIDGVPRVEQLRPAPAGRLAFARALVTLSNAQAAWFVRDLRRAREFAEEARAGLDAIGYERYARRAGRVAELLVLWQALSERDEIEQPDDPLPRLILKGVKEAANPLDLGNLRPSAALTVLCFLRKFADPTATRRIHLPPVIAEADGDLTLRPSGDAASVAEADRRLRQEMGIGEDNPVALLPD